MRRARVDRRRRSRRSAPQTARRSARPCRQSGGTRCRPPPRRGRRSGQATRQTRGRRTPRARPAGSAGGCARHLGGGGAGWREGWCWPSRVNLNTNPEVTAPVRDTVLLEVEMQPPLRRDVPMSKPRMSKLGGSQFERRWWILVVIGLAQLMVVLDATVVNVALPSAQRALHFSNDNRQWVVTAYALAFGSLLLLGGRLGDLFGRKWTLIGGLSGFAIASAIGGLSQSFGMLVAARALQGAFGAM